MKINIAVILVISSLLILFIYGIKKNNNFINISKIVLDHFKIFDGAKKHIIVLYLVPIITAIGISLLYTYSTSMVEAILVVISVVISALLSFQGGILNLDSHKDKKSKDLIVEETNSSINFTVLINIVLVFIMLIFVAIDNQMVRTVLTAIITYFLLITFLTIMLIIKRVRILFKHN